MKKLLVVVFITFFVFTLFSCKYKETQKIENVVPERIHVIEGNGFTMYRLVEVDGHEYLSATDGGIVHLESCPCKNR
jgi:hypothetical protein